MAFSATFRGGDANVTSATVSAFTPAAGSLLVATVGGSRTVAGDPTSTISVSGHGLTWTLRAMHYASVGSRTCFSSIWTVQVGDSPGSSTVTASCSSNNDGIIIALDELTTDNPPGFGALAGADRNDATGSLTFNLNAAPAAASRVYGAVYIKGESLDGSAMTPGTGWTEVWERPSFGSLTMSVQAREGSTSPAVLWDLVNASGSTTLAAAVALEITEGAPPISGTLDAQETGSDTAAITGGVLVSGTLAAQETGADTFAGTGQSGEATPPPIQGFGGVFVPTVRKKKKRVEQPGLEPRPLPVEVSDLIGEAIGETVEVAPQTVPAAVVVPQVPEIVAAEEFDPVELDNDLMTVARRIWDAEK